MERQMKMEFKLDIDSVGGDRKYTVSIEEVTEEFPDELDEISPALALSLIAITAIEFAINDNDLSKRTTACLQGALNSLRKLETFRSASTRDSRH
jgi:hypothetical protein